MSSPITGQTFDTEIVSAPVWEAATLALPILYATAFLVLVLLPERAVILEWLRREHINELLQRSTTYKRMLVEEVDEDVCCECALCLEPFHPGAKVRRNYFFPRQ